MSEVAIQTEGVDLVDDGLDWDSVEGESIEDSFENLEGDENEGNQEGNQEKAIGNEIKDSEEDGDGSEKDSPKDKGGEGKDSDKDSESVVELPENLLKMGVTLQGEDLGKMIVVDGEEQFVSLQELGNDYSGQRALATRFNELNQTKQEYLKEVQEVENYINTFASHLKKGDVLGAFQYFGEFADIPPYTIKEQLLASLGPEVERRANMSAQELQNELLKSQNEYLLNRKETMSKLREQQQAQEELQRSLSEFRDSQGISEEAWNEAEEVLKEHQKDLGEITKESVAEYVQTVAAYDLAEDVIQSTGVSPQDYESYLSNLSDIILHNPDFTQEDLESIVKGSIQKASESAISSSLERKLGKGSSIPKQKEEPTVELEALEDWDDL